VALPQNDVQAKPETVLTAGGQMMLCPRTQTQKKNAYCVLFLEEQNNNDAG